MISESSSWLRFLFGLDEGEVPSGGDSRFEFTGLWHGGAGWIAFFIVAGAIALIIALYRRERELTRWQRTSLGALRLGALAIVIWMLLDPRILTELQLKRPAHTYVLLDTSGSMAQADAFDGKELKGLEHATGLRIDAPQPRATLALAALEHERIIERLAEKNSVRTFTFDAGLKGVEALDAAAFRPPGGDETRLGDALGAVLKQAGADPIAGIVVISDGRSNAGSALEKGAAEVALRGVPVYAIGAGRQKDPQNLAITQLSGPDVAVAGFPIRIEGRVEVTGIREPITVTLSRQLAKGGTKEKVEERKVEGKSLSFSTTLVFVDTLPKNGTYRYTLSVPRHGEEVDPSDNQRAVQVTAADEKCRILLVAGAPSPEYVFLTRYLTRDKGLQVSCWLSSADSGRPQEGDVAIRELPVTAEKLRPYDVVLLLDPDARTVSDAFLQGLKEFVLEQGGGIACVAGICHGAELFESARFAALRALLPVEVADAASVKMLKERRKHTQAWRPALTRQGAEHPVCRLADDPGESAKVWSQLPPLYYNASVRTLKPAAATLLEKEGGDIIVAAQKAGAGYSIFLAIDDFSSRWRFPKEGIPERFWGSIIRYLALGKKVSGPGDVALFTDRDRYSQSEDIVFEASVTDAERKPVVKERVEVAVEQEEEAAPAGDRKAATASGGSTGQESVRLNLLPIANRPGWYTGSFRASHAGRYVAQISGAPDPSVGKARFLVVAPTSEWEDPTPDPAALEELARKTGGAYFPLEEIGQVPDRIGDRSLTEVIGRSASTIWDSSAVMVLFCALLIAEWSLRKLWRLN